MWKSIHNWATESYFNCLIFICSTYLLFCVVAALIIYLVQSFLISFDKEVFFFGYKYPCQALEWCV